MCCKIGLCLVYPPWWSKVVCGCSFIHLSRFILVFSCINHFHVFYALLLFALHIKRCPTSVNTFNHSHEFVQLSLASNLATFTSKWTLLQLPPEAPGHSEASLGGDLPSDVGAAQGRRGDLDRVAEDGLGTPRAPDLDQWQVSGAWKKILGAFVDAFTVPCLKTWLRRA
jgi:hypothetical protein